MMWAKKGAVHCREQQQVIYALAANGYFRQLTALAVGSLKTSDLEIIIFYCIGFLYVSYGGAKGTLLPIPLFLHSIGLAMSGQPNPPFFLSLCFAYRGDRRSIYGVFLHHTSVIALAGKEMTQQTRKGSNLEDCCSSIIHH